jgi:hypothetical protein
MFARFLKPGALMITTVPNLGGLVGLAQKMLDRGIFDKHVVLRQDLLREAHEDAGLSVVWCEFLLFTNFGNSRLVVEGEALPTVRGCVGQTSVFGFGP